MSDQLTQWARSLFNDISNPASAGNISTAARKDVQDHPNPLATPSLDDEGIAGTQAPPVDTPAPDFRYRPVTTSVRRRG